MANNTVNAVIKLRTTPPSDNKLEKGEVYIEIDSDNLSIFVGSNDNRDNNVLVTNIKPTILKLVGDHYEPESFGGFEQDVENNTINGLKGNGKNIDNLTLSELQKLVIDTTNSNICGTGVPSGNGEVGQLYFQINQTQSNN